MDGTQKDFVGLDFRQATSLMEKTGLMSASDAFEASSIPSSKQLRGMVMPIDNKFDWRKVGVYIHDLSVEQEYEIKQKNDDVFDFYNIKHDVTQVKSDFTDMNIQNDHIYYISTNPNTHINTKYLSREFCFDTKGTKLIGGVEVVRLSNEKSLTRCSICMSELDTNTCIFSPLNSDERIASFATYHISTTNGNGICDDCYNEGFVSSGKPVNVYAYLRGRNLLLDVVLDEEQADRVMFSGHATIQAIRTKLDINGNDIRTMCDIYQIGRSTSDYFGIRDGNNYGDDDWETDFGTVRDRAKLICIPKPEFVDKFVAREPNGEISYSRYNCNSFILLACRQNNDQDDDELKSWYSFTILPSIYSRNERFLPELKPYVIKDANKLLLDDIKSDDISTTLYKTGEGNPKITTLILKLFGISALDEMTITDKGFFLMTDYERSKCYICKRSKRGDTNFSCYGSKCEFNGRVAVYNGKIGSCAIRDYLNLLRDNAAYTRVYDDSPLNDVFTVREYTRCMMAGKAFSCCDTNGKAKVPKYMIYYNGYEIPSCVTCALNHVMLNGENATEKMERLIIPQESISFRVIDRDKFNSDIEKIFNYTEVPLCIPQNYKLHENIMDIGLVWRLYKKESRKGRESLREEAIEYLGTCNGDECLIISPTKYIKDSRFKSNLTFDLWPDITTFDIEQKDTINNRYLKNRKGIYNSDIMQNNMLSGLTNFRIIVDKLRTLPTSILFGLCRALSDYRLTRRELLERKRSSANTITKTFGKYEDCLLMKKKSRFSGSYIYFEPDISQVRASSSTYAANLLLNSFYYTDDTAIKGNITVSQYIYDAVVKEHKNTYKIPSGESQLFFNPKDMRIIEVDREVITIQYTYNNYPIVTTVAWDYELRPSSQLKKGTNKTVFNCMYGDQNIPMKICYVSNQIIYASKLLLGANE